MSNQSNDLDRMLKMTAAARLRRRIVQNHDPEAYTPRLPGMCLHERPLRGVVLGRSAGCRGCGEIVRWIEETQSWMTREERYEYKEEEEYRTSSRSF